MDWRGIVGRNIRQLREGSGLTQEALAHDAELDVGYLGRIERGERNPSLMVLVRISAQLKVHPAELLNDKK